MRIYIAGGAVRDLLLGRPLRDLDYVFDGAEEAFIQRNPAARKIRSAPCPIYLLDGREYTPLTEGDAARDLRRRDFTINALLLTQDGLLLAHPEALADLKNGLIRPASPRALSDDPVRVLRAARLAASLPDFRLSPEALKDMREVGASGALASIPAEQAGRELCKACAAARPGNFLRSLEAAGCLKPWFAELAGASALPAGPPAYHDCHVLEHTARVMDLTAAATPAEDRESTGEQAPAARGEAEEEERALAVWMALCHDLGKTLTDPAALPRHYGHEERGVAPALALGSRLRLSRRQIQAGRIAAALHMKAGQYPTLRPGTRVDLLMILEQAGLFRPFFRMVRGDSRDPDIEPLARADRVRILTRHLPEEWRNLGERSGRRLRELRCQALGKR